jgi:Arc/MetJ-type ribon-helix-helix transcriptional regulator
MHFWRLSWLKYDFLLLLPADIATLVRNAVAAGDYASSSEVIREALRECWLHASNGRRFVPRKSRGVRHECMERRSTCGRTARSLPSDPKAARLASFVGPAHSAEQQ